MFIMAMLSAKIAWKGGQVRFMILLFVVGPCWERVGIFGQEKLKGDNDGKTKKFIRSTLSVFG